MPRPTPLPDSLRGRPFTVAEARELGLSHEVLAGGRLRAPFHGVRVEQSAPDSLELRCRAAALVLPSRARFSHVTAARIRKVPVPGSWEDDSLDVVTTHRGLQLKGVRFHHSASGDEAIVVRGLLLSGAAAMWAELAARLELDDLVIAGDYILRRGWLSPTDLRSVALRSQGRRGVRQLRAAMTLVHPRVDSPMETRLRLLLVRGGLPLPCVNENIIEDGEWLARPDLSYPHLRIAIEYEGDHHRTDRRQWKRDKGRRRVLEDAGWLIIEVIDDDVFRTPEATLARVRSAIEARTCKATLR